MVRIPQPLQHRGFDILVKTGILPRYLGMIYSGLGPLIYFIMTGSYPYEDVFSDEVEKLYDVQQFPDVSSIVCGAIVMQCWRRQVDSAQVIHDCITAIEREKTRR